MHSPLVFVLLSVLQLCITSFPAVAGDCWDEPPNNMSYDNCATCYQTFANALINTADNKYHLSEAFLTIGAVPPVQVEVTYSRMSTDIMTDESNDTRAWYWVKGGFYVFQPLELFLYRSIFFSPPTWRQDSLKLMLPDQCFVESNQSENFFRYATQRVSLRSPIYMCSYSTYAVLCVGVSKELTVQ